MYVYMYVYVFIRNTSSGSKRTKVNSSRRFAGEGFFNGMINDHAIAIYPFFDFKGEKKPFDI